MGLAPEEVQMLLVEVRKGLKGHGNPYLRLLVTFTPVFCLIRNANVLMTVRAHGRRSHLSSDWCGAIREGQQGLYFCLALCM